MLFIYPRWAEMKAKRIFSSDFLHFFFKKVWVDFSCGGVMRGNSSMSKRKNYIVKRHLYIDIFSASVYVYELRFSFESVELIVWSNIIITFIKTLYSILYLLDNKRNRKLNSYFNNFHHIKRNLDRLKINFCW